MKDKNRFFKRFSRIVSILVLFCYGSAVQLTAQDATFQYEGTYHDYVIPQTTKKYAVLTAVGGDGGRIHFKNLLTDFQVGGGRGGLLKAYFKIGNASNNLKPGSTLRFIVGESGESRLTAGSTGAGGGGGTGIAYKEVGTQEWILLMVAGGGGGAGHSWLTGKDTGNPGPAYIEGEEGDGLGGTSSTTAGGGGGAFGDDARQKDGTGMDPKYVYGEHAKAGWSGGPDTGEPTGGNCVGDGPQGGFGFGAGGDGNATSCEPGGGGGYTGGDLGGPNGYSDDHAAGGTSYVNTSMQNDYVLPVERGTTTSPENGYASLELVDESPVISIRPVYNILLCITPYTNRTDNGTNIQTDNWIGTDAQKWYFYSEDRTIRSKLNTAKCLDLSSSNTSNGNNIQLWDCNGTSAQKWVYNGIHKTVHSGVNSDKCIDASNGTANPSASVNIQLWDCQYANNNQKWNIAGATTVSNSANMKHIIPAFHTGFAVHSSNAEVSGSNIQ
ncbi:MAG: RICIN domain-containing protein, partial [Saprospiraceae bacterium]|nr:RICIN domain-containing protein [Saprospiraceae bacterium]